MGNSDNNTANVESGDTISVITATYNAAEHLPRLIESLRNQKEKNFEWVIADGGSTDETLDLIAAIDDIHVRVVSKRDFGIYDALNQAIQQSRGQWYVVIGADDFFYSNALADFKKSVNARKSDIHTAKLKLGDKVLGVRGGGAWINKQFSYVSSHSVGTLFRRSLHDDYGYYSNKYPIAADQHFILTVCRSGADVTTIDSVVGEFSYGGVSSTDVLGTLSESLRIQLLFYSKWPQLVIYFLKFIKNLHRI